jgi:dTMP kinase
MNHKIIAIEGIDGSGKNTQSRLLVENLKKQGLDVEFLGFPCYGDTFFGKEIGFYLNGDFGGLNEVHPKLASILYAGDRLEKKPFIEQTLAAGKILVIDRYVSSNIAHQGAKMQGEQRQALCEWLNELEYEVYGLPKPTLNVLLNMDVISSTSLVLKKDARDYTDKKQDLHEADGDYMSKVAHVYHQLSHGDDWYRVECINDGKIRSIEDISAEILKQALIVLA